jgi:hypothetical protein
MKQAVLSDLIETEVSQRFSKKNSQVQNCMTVRAVLAELTHADRRTDMTTQLLPFAILRRYLQRISVQGPKGNKRYSIHTENEQTNCKNKEVQKISIK